MPPQPGRAAGAPALPAEIGGGRRIAIKIGLPDAELAPLLRQALAGQPGQAEVSAADRRGRPVRMLVQARLLADSEGRPRGVILIMNELTALSYGPGRLLQLPSC